VSIHIELELLAIIRTIVTILILLGSYWYWTSWERRSKRIKEEIIKELNREA